MQDSVDDVVVVVVAADDDDDEREEEEEKMVEVWVLWMWGCLWVCVGGGTAGKKDEHIDRLGACVNTHHTMLVFWSLLPKYWHKRFFFLFCPEISVLCVCVWD